MSLHTSRNNYKHRNQIGPYNFWGPKDYEQLPENLANDAGFCITLLSSCQKCSWWLERHWQICQASSSFSSAFLDLYSLWPKLPIFVPNFSFPHSISPHPLRLLYEHFHSRVPHQVYYYPYHYFWSNSHFYKCAVFLL